MCAKYNPEYDPIPYEAVDAVIDMPDVPETINSDTLSNLYCDCVYAFWNACANAKELLTNPIKRGTAGDLKEVLKLKGVDKFKYEFEYDNALLTVKASVYPWCEFAVYYESFPAQFPTFTVESIAFNDKAIRFTVELSSEDPMVTLSNGSDDIVNMPLNLFVATPEIRFKNIVSYNLVFSNDIGQVIDNFELYKKIFDAVLEYGYEAFRKTTHVKNSQSCQAALRATSKASST